MRPQQSNQTDKIQRETAPRSILVWDAPVRVFHWLMVLSFAGAYLTAEMDEWRLLHVTLGYTMAALVVFRLVWGVIGTRYARFANFVRGPRAVAHYVVTLFQRQPEHYFGHNPAGAVTILAFLLLTAIVAGFGWATYYELGGEAMEKLHEIFANLMLAIIGIHVVGVVVSSWVHQENLIGAMISGRKIGQPQDGIHSPWRTVAVVVLLCVLLFWWFQLHDAQNAEPGDRPTPTASVSTNGVED
jgi:cytochrome b